MLGFVIMAPLCLQNLSTVQLISWSLNKFPQFSIRRQVENNWLPWQHLRTKENFKTCKIILNGVKKLVKFLYSILSRLGVVEKSSHSGGFRPPPPPRLDRVNPFGTKGFSTTPSTGGGGGQKCYKSHARGILEGFKKNSN